LTFLNFISIAGVALGVMALIIVTAVMTGFGNNLRDKIIGATPHIMVEKETGIKDYEKVAQVLTSVEGVKSVSPYILGNIFLDSPSQSVGRIVRGIDPKREHGVTKIKDYMVEGSLDQLNKETIIIGSELARYYDYSLGDEIVLISPGSGIAGEGWKYKKKIAGIFSTGMVDFDTNLLIVNLVSAQKLLNLTENKVTGIGVKAFDPERANDVKQNIYEAIGYSFITKTWIDINRNLFEALFLEKWGLFLILTLMVLVASFNIISTLIVTVSSKIHDIGVLQSIGVPKSSIRKIFTKQGILIGSAGTFLGVIGGFGICFILQNYVEVPKEIYSIDRVPVDIQLFDTLMIVLAALLISLAATIYPAVKAGQLQPVEALRYE